MEARMTDELVFYTNPMSRGRIVRWMLEEIGQPTNKAMGFVVPPERERMAGYRSAFSHGHSAGQECVATKRKRIVQCR